MTNAYYFIGKNIFLLIKLINMTNRLCNHTKLIKYHVLLKNKLWFKNKNIINTHAKAHHRRKKMTSLSCNLYFWVNCQSCHSWKSVTNTFFKLIDNNK